MTTQSPRLLRILAGAAIITAGLALSGCSILNGLTGGVERDDDGNVTSGNENADAFSIQVGDCLNDAELSTEFDTVPIVPCSDPHDSEVYYSHLLADGDYPGSEVISEEAADACLTEYESFVGVAYEDSTLDATYFSPTTESWANGDREILCIVFDPAGQVTGSLAGAQK